MTDQSSSLDHVADEPLPHPGHYIDYANQFLRAGSALLPSQKEQANCNAQIAVSVGLFLQSMELAGKSILRATRMPPGKIRNEYMNHKLWVLLNDSQTRVKDKASSNPDLEPFADFLDRETRIFAHRFRDNLGSFLEALRKGDKASSPRNYFYPDLPKFFAFTPPERNIAIKQMTGRLIKDGSEIARILNWDTD